jgi:subtilisin family serine protease
MALMNVRARCEPNWAYRVTITPNDPDYSLQYASSFLSLPAAWDKTTGSSNLVAVVIDSGIQLDHPDLTANIWTNPGEIPGNGIDDDANGYIDDIHGINAITGTGPPNDDSSHGTHCAGILGAKGNNSTGIAGVSWSAKIAAAKFLDGSGSGYTSDAIESIYYTIALKQAGNNVVVSSNSWGGGGYSAALYTAIQQSIAAGILFVAAAGNDTINTDVYPSYPSSYNLDGIISVASSNSSGNLSYFSNFGTATVDIAAPGSAIRSCIPTSSYAIYSGTSMAAPQVSGIALLAQSICNGSLTVAQLKAAIINSGVAYSSLDGQIATGAIANADGAITAANITCNGAPTATPTNTPENTPTDTPIPPQPTDTPEPEVPTPVPAKGSDPNAKMTITINPESKLAPNDSISITIDNAGTSKRASLLFLGRDLNKRNYSCPEIAVPLTDGAATISFAAPSAIRQFSVVTVSASAGRKNARDSASVISPSKNRSFSAGQRAFRTLCSTIRRAAN